MFEQIKLIQEENLQKFDELKRNRENFMIEHKKRMKELEEATARLNQSSSSLKEKSEQTHSEVTDMLNEIEIMLNNL